MWCDAALDVLIFSPYFAPHVGGVESYVAELNAELLGEHLVDSITVIAPRLPRVGEWRETLSPGYRVVRFPAVEPIANFPLPAVWRPGLWRALRACRVADHDLVVCHTRFFPSSLTALAVAKWSHRPLLHIEHGADSVQLRSGLARRLAQLYDRWPGRLVLRRADAVVAVSSAAAAFVMRISGRSATVIYRGAPSRLGHVVADSGLLLRASGAPIVLYAGRLIDGKGLPDLLEAFAGVSAASSLLCVVGDGPQRRELETQADRLGIAERVWFRGYLPESDTLAAMRAADIVVSPSYTEGLPTSVLEAALLGRAVIATDVGGTGEIVVDGHSALLYPPRDRSALRRSLERLLEDPELRTGLGARAQADARLRFSWATAAREFAGVAQGVAGSRAGEAKTAS